MSNWIDDQYALQVFAVLPRYKQVANSPLRLTARCPICGDSQKDEYKARFWYFYHDNTAFVHCYNCDYSNGFNHFLREHDPELFSKFQMEKFKEGAYGVKRREVVEEPKFTKTFDVIKTLAFSERLDRFRPDHPIVKYVEGRMIPKKQWSRLWFTSKWQELVNSIKPDTFPTPKPEHRLVIPIFNAKGEIESFQGRALRPCANKYMTIKADDAATKIYGLDTVDESLDYVFVMEGPLDSLFLDNALAITGGSLSLDMVPYPDKRIWVLDNECRHKDTLARMEKLIEAGETVCFWDAAPWKSKDINEMITEDGATPEEIKQYILDNSVSGLLAKAKLAKFRRI